MLTVHLCHNVHQVISHHRTGKAIEKHQSSLPISDNDQTTHLPHSGLTPQSRISPPPKTRFIITLFPHEDCTRPYIHVPLKRIKSTLDRLEESLSDSLQYNVGIASVSDV